MEKMYFNLFDASKPVFPLNIKVLNNILHEILQKSNSWSYIFKSLGL